MKLRAAERLGRRPPVIEQREESVVGRGRRPPPQDLGDKLILLTGRVVAGLVLQTADVSAGRGGQPVAC